MQPPQTHTYPPLTGGHIAHAMGSDGRPTGPLRVWPGGVAMARSIGDADVGAAISPLPDVSVTTLGVRGATIILASDGVWDQLSIKHVHKLAEMPTVARNAQKMSQGIVRKAATLHQAYATSDYGKPKDDTTCVCILFYPDESKAKKMSRMERSRAKRMDRSRAGPVEGAPATSWPGRSSIGAISEGVGEAGERPPTAVADATRSTAKTPEERATHPAAGEREATNTAKGNFFGPSK